MEEMQTNSSNNISVDKKLNHDQDQQEKEYTEHNKNSSEENDEPLPEGWVKRLSKSKNRPYYYNTKTRESLWERPSEDTSDRSKKHPNPTANHSSSSNNKKPKPSTDVAEKEKSKELSKVRASHILVKHTESRRPSSWRQDTITRTKDEAWELIAEYRHQIESGSSFEALATEASDCSSAKHSGDLGYFGPGKMQKPFEDAAFALQVGEISDIIDTESGLHIIQRTA